MRDAIERDEQQSNPCRLNLKVRQQFSCHHVVTDIPVKANNTCAHGGDSVSFLVISSPPLLVASLPHRLHFSLSHHLVLHPFVISVHPFPCDCELRSVAQLFCPLLTSNFVVFIDAAHCRV